MENCSELKIDLYTGVDVSLSEITCFSKISCECEEIVK